MSAAPSTSPVRLQLDDGVATLTLADSARRNVLSTAMIDGIVAAVDTVANSDARVLVVRAEGKAFCAGAELDVLEAGIHGDFSGIEHVYRAFLAVAELAIPTIAAVQGPAVGAGLNLALACDVRVAAVEALFDSRFSAMQLHPGGGHVWMLDRLVGPQATTAMTLLGERIDGEQALRLGLVWSVHSAADLDSAAQHLAQRVRAYDPVFVRSLLETIRRTAGTQLYAAAVAEERAAQRESIARPAFIEGITLAKQRLSESRGSAPRA